LRVRWLATKQTDLHTMHARLRSLRCVRMVVSPQLPLQSPPRSFTIARPAALATFGRTTSKRQNHRNFTTTGAMGDSGVFPAKEASDLLIRHWENGTTLENLPAHLSPKSIAQGFEIQSHILRQTSSPLWGWKIAATSKAGQTHINVDRPLAGRILAERITPYGQPVPLGHNRMKVAELEFAFRIGSDIEPRKDGKEWTMDEVMDRVSGMYLGSEIPDSRYEDFTKVGAAALLADIACGDRYVLGPEVPEEKWRRKDLIEHGVKGWVVGKEGDVTVGKGGNVLGDPRIAMQWIANELGREDITLKKGEYVTTGTCIVPIHVEPGDKVIGDYGDFGKIELSFVQ
jgi:2-keto-4-pentenoate hydratase